MTPCRMRALARLPALHGEAGRDLQLSRFLARSPRPASP